MSNVEILIQKLLSKPYRNDIKLKDLEKILNYYKFEKIRTNGSHTIYSRMINNHRVTFINPTHPSQKNVLAYNVRQLYYTLLENGLLEEFEKEGNTNE